jgi:valyl-tRNA synthetase
MPFITEALWASLPHRASDPELLIVARWPAVGARDEAAEAQVETIRALVTEIRNARAAAKVPAGDWLATRVYVPADLGSTFEGLRPAIERLARARPLARDLTPEQLQGQVVPGDLVVIVPGSETQAVVRPEGGDVGAASLERQRLERELAEAEGWLAAARERLANDAFASRAPAAVVDGARAREAELADQVVRLREALGR